MPIVLFTWHTVCCRLARLMPVSEPRGVVVGCQHSSRLPLLAAYMYSFRSTSPWVRRHWRYRFHTVTSVSERRTGGLLIRNTTKNALFYTTAVFDIYCVTQRYWLDQDLALILLDACFSDPVSWNRLSEAIGYWHDTVVCLSVCLWRFALWRSGSV